MLRGFKTWLFSSLLAAAFAVAPAHAKTLSFPRELPQPQAPAISRDAGLPGLSAADLAAETETFLLAAPDGQLFLAAYAGKNPHNGATVYVLSPLGLDPKYAEDRSPRDR